jgi:hypothetical protein
MHRPDTYLQKTRLIERFLSDSAVASAMEQLGIWAVELGRWRATGRAPGLGLCMVQVTCYGLLGPGLRSETSTSFFSAFKSGLESRVPHAQTITRVELNFLTRPNRLTPRSDLKGTQPFSEQLSN